MATKKRSRFPLIFILVILTLTGIVVYSIKTKLINPFFSSIISEQYTSIQTANWKTYTNNAFKYSFKYPPDWRLPQKDVYGEVPQGDYMIVSSPDQVGIGEYPDKENLNHLTVGVNVLNEGEVFNPYWEKNLKITDKITVGGLSAQVGIASEANGPDIYPNDPSYHHWVTIVDYNSKVYYISASPLNSKKLDIYYQILSTFKFLD